MIGTARVPPRPPVAPARRRPRAAPSGHSPAPTWVTLTLWWLHGFCIKKPSRAMREGTAAALWQRLHAARTLHEVQGPAAAAPPHFAAPFRSSLTSA